MYPAGCTQDLFDRVHDDLGPEPDEEDCRVCGQRYELGGDGYDGLCPSCADKANEIADGDENLTWDEAVDQLCEVRDEAAVKQKLNGRRKARRSLAARMRREALDSLGMKKVRGALGGIYYE